MPDVTIVGGGPAGTLAARLIAASGRSVTVMEEHSSIGEPLHCAGVVTSRTIDGLGLRPTVLNSLTGADVVLPNDDVLELKRSIPLAYAVDRVDLDRRLAEAAVDAGAELQCDCKYLEHTVSETGVTVKTSVGETKSELLVGADGHASRIAKSIPDNDARELVVGLQVELDYASDEQDRLRLFVGNSIAPGFFAWQIPLGDTTRFGLAISSGKGTPSEYMGYLLKKLGIENKTRLNTYGGVIPIGGRKTVYGDRLMLIGDAAGQIKPVSGGGLNPITYAAPLLKETVDKAFDTGVFDSTVTSGYGKLCDKALGKSFRRARKVRKEYCKMDDMDLSLMGGRFATPEICNILSQIDIDDPSNVVLPILSQKGMKSTLLKYYLGLL
ncbi:MAG: NAD(P)/FAD-dependent oxidoreductase [archaeon]|nr:NAD(P)/FAD-dependent oxidoreductase [archaeon]